MLLVLLRIASSPLAPLALLLLFILPPWPDDPNLATAGRPPFFLEVKTELLLLVHALSEAFSLCILGIRIFIVLVSLLVFFVVISSHIVVPIFIIKIFVVLFIFFVFTFLFVNRMDPSYSFELLATSVGYSLSVPIASSFTPIENLIFKLLSQVSTFFSVAIVMVTNLVPWLIVLNIATTPSSFLFSGCEDPVLLFLLFILIAWGRPSRTEH
jgi:hypothetical protein